MASKYSKGVEVASAVMRVVANLSGKKYHAPPYLRDAVNKILTIFWSNGKDTRGGLEMVSLIPTGFEIS